jgi:hypothetical protein
MVMQKLVYNMDLFALVVLVIIGFALCVRYGAFDWSE